MWFYCDWNKLSLIFNEIYKKNATFFFWRASDASEIGHFRLQKSQTEAWKTLEGMTYAEYWIRKKDNISPTKIAADLIKTIKKKKFSNQHIYDNIYANTDRDRYSFDRPLPIYPFGSAFNIRVEDNKTRPYIPSHTEMHSESGSQLNWLGDLPVMQNKAFIQSDQEIVILHNGSSAVFLK